MKTKLQQCTNRAEVLNELDRLESEKVKVHTLSEQDFPAWYVYGYQSIQHFEFFLDKRETVKIIQPTLRSAPFIQLRVA